jgi:hypothetical protein
MSASARMANPGGELQRIARCYTSFAVNEARGRRRDAFTDAVHNFNAVWISNEAPGVFPAFAKTVPQSPAPGLFLMALDGKPVAWIRPHGQSIE